MDYKNLVETFWNNVSNLKNQRNLTWKDIAANTGHTGASISAMRNGHKMPSMGIARSIARSLGMTIEALCSDDAPAGCGGTLRDALYNASEGLNDINLVSMISLAESLKKTQDEVFPDGTNEEWYGYVEGVGLRKLGDRVASLKMKYLVKDQEKNSN